MANDKSADKSGRTLFKASKRYQSRILSSKRSQLYLLAVIVLSLLVFLMLDIPSKMHTGNREPFLLYQNFVSQMPMVLNSAVYNSRNITLDAADYSDKFIIHSAAKNINLSIFYIIHHEEIMLIRNLMGSEAEAAVSGRSYTIPHGDSIYLSYYELIRITCSGTDYNFNIAPGRTGFKTIFRASDNQGNIEVYTYG